MIPEPVKLTVLAVTDGLRSIQLIWASTPSSASRILTSWLLQPCAPLSVSRFPAVPSSSSRSMRRPALPLSSEDSVPSGESLYFTFYGLALSWNFPALWTLSMCISCISLTYIAVCTHRPHGFLKCRVFNSFFLQCQCLNAYKWVAEPCTQHSVSLPASVRWKVPSSSQLHLKVALWHDCHMPWMCVTTHLIEEQRKRVTPTPASLPSRTGQGRESPWSCLPSPWEGVIKTLHNFSLTVYSLTATRIIW